MIDDGEKKEELKIIEESKLYYPDPEKTKKSVAKSVENFQSLLQESWENPLKFWSEVKN